MNSKKSYVASPILRMSRANARATVTDHSFVHASKESNGIFAKCLNLAQNPKPITLALRSTE